MHFKDARCGYKLSKFWCHLKSESLSRDFIAIVTWKLAVPIFPHSRKYNFQELFKSGKKIIRRRERFYVSCNENIPHLPETFQILHTLDINDTHISLFYLIYISNLDKYCFKFLNTLIIFYIPLLFTCLFLQPISQMLIRFDSLITIFDALDGIERGWRKNLVSQANRALLPRVRFWSVHNLCPCSFFACRSAV